MIFNEHFRETTLKLSLFSNALQTRKGIPNVTSFVTIIPWMETQDKCDPGSLRKNSTVSHTHVF